MTRNDLNFNTSVYTNNKENTFLNRLCSQCLGICVAMSELKDMDKRGIRVLPEERNTVLVLDYKLSTLMSGYFNFIEDSLDFEAVLIDNNYYLVDADRKAYYDTEHMAVGAKEYREKIIEEYFIGTYKNCLKVQTERYGTIFSMGAVIRSQ